MTADERPIRTVSSEIVWSCPWYRVRRDEVILPNGQAGVYNVVEKADAVWIVPVTEDGHIVLIHQYRHTVGEWCWEVPAGNVNQGQTTEEAARDELRQEVGGEARNLTYIGRFFLANGICDEVGHIFLATGVVLGQADHESAEVIRVYPKPIDEVVHMARFGLISDGPTALALLLCESSLTGRA